MNRRLLVFILLTLMGFDRVVGQNTIGLPLIINYNKADFHGGAQTWGIAQDKNGFLYFANNEGLLSFDGTYWKVYPLPNRTIMRSIAIDNQRIYAGGQSEMGYFEPDGKGFLHYTSLVDLLPADKNQFADVWDIQVLGESVFFRTTDRIFELRNGSMQVFYPKTQWQFMAVGGQSLFAQDKNHGLLRYSNNQWVPVQNNHLLEDEVVSGIIAMHQDSFLVSTINRGSFLLHNDSLYRLNIYGDAHVPNTAIFRTAQLNKNEFAAATTSEGCIILNFKGQAVQTISRREGLQNNTVLCAFLDRDGNLWTGGNNGISLVAYNAAIKYIRPSKENELSGYSARIFHNDLYIATSDGVYRAPLAAGKGPGADAGTLAGSDGDLSFSKGEFSLIRNSNGQVWRLDEVNQQIVMGANRGTFCVRGDEAVSISPDATWTFLPVSAVMPSRYVVAGTYTGLKVLDFSGGQFTDAGNPEGNYESYRFLAMDNNNLIWASHPYRGVYQLILSPDRKRYTARLFTDKEGLPTSLNNFVFRIKNRIVFATEKGAYEFDAGTKRFVPSAFLAPVFGTMELRYLNEDAQGNIWFVSGKRLGVVSYNSSLGSSPYAPSSLPTPSTTTAAPVAPGDKSFTITWIPEVTGDILSGFENVYPLDKENIFISSEKGIIHLNYEKYIHNHVDLSVLMGNVRVLSNPDSLLSGGYPQTAVPHLPARFDSYHFEFSAPNYGLQKNIEYSYKLEGYDREWSGWTHRSEKDYTNLPDGEYLFKVKAHDNLGNESQPVTYSFFINPPFYKTVWAYGVYLLLFFFLIYGIRKGQERSLRLQKEKYEQRQEQIIALHNLEREKTEKEIIKLQNDRLAHEVTLKKKELADASMHLVEREDALNRVKDELQKLYKKTGDNHDVKVALQLLNGVEKNHSNWDQFASHFNEISNDFLKKLKALHPMLTNSDLKVCAYLQLNLSSKEIAQLMNISVRGVEMSRYRIRKKLSLPQEQSLHEFLNSIG